LLGARSDPNPVLNIVSLLCDSFSSAPARSSAPAGALDLLDPTNSVLILIDHQPAMTAGVASIDRQTLINNTVALLKAAKVFNIPVVLTAVESKGFSGNLWPQLTEVVPSVPIVERSSMNSWEDANFVAAVKKTGRKKLIMAALWTEVCLAFPVMGALKDGYQVYAVEDCSGGTSETAHKAAMQRVIQAGAVPVTWNQVMLEWQRDWSRKATYDGVMKIVLEVRYSR
jgi:nicotinamidase-related amidase